MVNDGDSLIWVGTYGGVNSISLRNNQIRSFTKSDGMLPSNIVYSIALDKKGNVLLGTSDCFTVYNKEKANSTHFTTANGLPSNVIRGIVVDNSGDVWLSTHTGVSK